MIRACLILIATLLMSPLALAEEASQRPHLIEVRISGVGVDEPLAGTVMVALNDQVQLQHWSADATRPVQARFTFAVSALTNESLALNITTVDGAHLLVLDGRVTASDIVLKDSYVSPEVRLDENASSLLIVTSPVEGRFRAQVTYRNASTAPQHPARLILDVPSGNATQTIVDLTLAGRVAVGEAELTSAPATMTFALVVSGRTGPIYVQNGTMDWVTGALVVRSPGADDTRADAVLAETDFDPTRNGGGTGLGLPNNVLTRSARVAQITEPRAPVGVTVRIGAPLPEEAVVPTPNDTNVTQMPPELPTSTSEVEPASSSAASPTPAPFLKTLAIVGATAAVISAAAAVGTWALRARSRRRREEYGQQFAREVLGR